MAKKGIATKARVMTACVCSVCGQRSNAQVDTVHFGCTGVEPSFWEKAPKLRGRFSRPNGKGKWEAVKVEQVAAA